MTSKLSNDGGDSFRTIPGPINDKSPPFDSGHRQKWVGPKSGVAGVISVIAKKEYGVRRDSNRPEIALTDSTLLPASIRFSRCLVIDVNLHVSDFNNIPR